MNNKPLRNRLDVLNQVFNENLANPQFNQDVMNSDARIGLAEMLATIIDYYHKDKEGEEIDVKVFVIVLFILMMINNGNLVKNGEAKHFEMIAILVRSYLTMKGIKDGDISKYGLEIEEEVRKLYDYFFEISSLGMYSRQFLRDTIFLLTNKETDKLTDMFHSYIRELNIWLEEIDNYVRSNNNEQH